MKKTKLEWFSLECMHLSCATYFVQSSGWILTVISKQGNVQYFYWGSSKDAISIVWAIIL